MRDVVEQVRVMADQCGTKAALAAAVTYLVGPVDAAVYGLLTLWAIDFGLGFGRALWCGRLSSRRMLRGTGKILLYGVAMIMGHVLDQLFFTAADVAFPVTCRNLIIVYLALNESLSICEHLACLNVPLPGRLVQRLKCYRDSYCNLPEDAQAGTPGTETKERGDAT